MRHALVWLVVAIVSLFALAYLFSAQSNGNASSWILWEKTMTMNDGGTATAWAGHLSPFVQTAGPRCIRL